MYEQQPEAHHKQEAAEETFDPSHLVQSPILPLASQPVNRKEAKESEKYIKITACLADRAAEILHFNKALAEVHNRQKIEENPQQLCMLIEQQLTLEQHIQRLQEESDVIRWQVVSRQATVTFSDTAARRLLEIQGQIGQAVGALSALGSSLAFSLLFSATRGDLWCMYAAWWLFLIALCITSALGLAGAGIDNLNKRPSQSEWTARRLSVIGIIIGNLSAVGGFYAFSVAAVAYDLTEELQTGKPVISGPRPGNWRARPGLKAIEFLIISLFAILWVGGFVRTLRPGLRVRNQKVRRNRRTAMFDQSQSVHPVRATTLSDILGEDENNEAKTLN